MNRTASLERSFSQADFDAFAHVSGDNNPIHVDPEFAARTRFGQTVAHGALLCAVLRGLVEELVPGGRQIRQATQYSAPSPVDQRLRFDAEMVAENGSVARIRLQVMRLSDMVITCSGETEVEA
ncbi:MaoC/PaaZ C-terminal domain-containing protein [Maricaulis salignorans]|uniref:MaoC like domain-containing protein n=1 Tax=Maricaulis salignorans TaxID=144026 RepID=A0A1G9WDW3_9PROT|nr:MaoC/PaaZ C-terminal domain-containing protein [Maricaulis salignorans]SDM82754.1 MaoC like domain-containing protein [Maricaulis salignorans]